METAERYLTQRSQGTQRVLKQDVNLDYQEVCIVSKARKILTIMKILFLLVSCDANYQTEASCKENIDVSILSFVLFAPLLTKNIDTNDPEAAKQQLIRERAYSALLLYQISLYEGCENSPSFDNGFKLLRD